MTDLPDDPNGDDAFRHEVEEALRMGREALLGDDDTGAAAEPEAGAEVGAASGDGKVVSLSKARARKAEEKQKGDKPKGRKLPPAPGDDGDPSQPRVYRTMWRPRIARNDEIEYVPALQWPEDSPVIPLGKNGGLFSFLNPDGELIDMEAGKMGQAHIGALFAGKQMFLSREFPAFTQGGNWKGFDAKWALLAAQEACGRKGLFDAKDKVRGRGCWVDADGKLVQHVGDTVLVDGFPHPPGVIDAHVYPGRPKVPAPVQAEDGEAMMYDHYATLRTWSYARGDIDARLLLGFKACLVLGAALEWRPSIFITGDAGTGKSTLMNQMKAMLPGRLIATVDATPASLRRMIGQDSVGVLFDEIEADVLSDAAINVMKLARVAASGGSSHRASGDKNSAEEFTLRGCFAFSAIVPPSMRGQDMQRLAFIRLKRLRPGQTLTKPTAKQAERMGQVLAGRVARNWHRWAATLEAYKEALFAVGHTDRSAMQFGSLLAGADILLSDQMPAASELALWAGKLTMNGLFEYESSTPEWLKVFNTILQAQPAAWAADKYPTVAEVVRQAMNTPPRSPDRLSAAKKLERAGLALVESKKGEFYLAIPPRHGAIQKIFAGTDYQAKGGEGPWTTVLRNAEPVKINDYGWVESGQYAIEKVSRLPGPRCTLIFLGAKHDDQPIFARGTEDGWLSDEDYEQTPADKGAADDAAAAFGG